MLKDHGRQLEANGRQLEAHGRELEAQGLELRDIRRILEQKADRAGFEQT